LACDSKYLIVSTVILGNTLIFGRVLIEVGLGHTLDLDGDAGLDVGELLVALLQPEGVDEDVEDDDQLNRSTNLQVENKLGN